MKTTVIVSMLSGSIGALVAFAMTSSNTFPKAIGSDTPAVIGNVQDIPQATASQSSLRQPQVQRQLMAADTLTAEEQTNIAVYERCNRSVVNIRTVIENVSAWSLSPVPSEGAGSGWVYDKLGHIVTNYHVVADSNLIEVMLYNGISAKATIVGADPANDVALLKAEFPAEFLIPLSIGDSSSLKVGQKIFAIGNPFGLERTMTVGIVSSLNRSLRANTKPPRLMKSIIQIDAALNQGNSGGPLLNSQGTLVGMNTAIATTNGENTGVGFSIAANSIRRVLPQLIEHGRVIRPTLGIVQTFPTNDGIGIYQLVEGGPAEKANLKPALWIESRRFSGGTLVTRHIEPEKADRILEIDGQPVESFDELLSLVEQKQPGERIELTILRQNNRRKINLTLSEE